MFHKEGLNTITITSILIVAGIIFVDNFLDTYIIQKSAQILLVVVFLLVLQFFRNPKRNIILNENHIIAPVDGKVVLIEEVYESEYFKSQRLQISIFIAPTNVHVIRYAVSGLIKYSKYYDGKHISDCNQKAPLENGSASIVIDTEKFKEILYRQIAGTFTKRIVNYAFKGNTATQGEDSGFMNLGSRVDLFLPLSTKVNVKTGDTIKGGEHIIACI
jgi:phosphatidylserine decarboxylase